MNYIEIEKEMAKTYNAIASKYEEEAKEDWKEKKYVDLFLQYLSNNASILDIACGTGELLKYYNNKGFIVTGIDLSKEMIKIAKTKVPNANLMEMSLYDINKLKQKYDGISATFTFVHIPKEKINEVIKNIREQLNQKGIFFAVFTTSLQEGLQEEPLDNSYKYYAVNYCNIEIKNILTNNGFEILESIETARINKSNIGIVIAKKL